MTVSLLTGVGFGGAAEMTRAVREALASLIRGLANRAEVPTEDILEIVALERLLGGPQIPDDSAMLLARTLQVIGENERVSLALRLEPLHEDRDEHRRQDPPEDEVVDDVRRRVGDVVRVGHGRGHDAGELREPHEPGDPRQQRARGDIGERVDFAVGATFPGQFVAQKLDRGIFYPAGKVEQHAVRPEIGQRLRIEVFDRGEIAVVEQARPMIVGAHLHAALILPDRAGRRFARGFVLAEFNLGPVFARLAIVRKKAAIGVHAKSPVSLQDPVWRNMVN